MLCFKISTGQIEKRLKYNKAVLTYKALNKQTPDYISSLLKPLSETHSLNFRSSENKIKIKTEKGTSRQRSGKGAIRKRFPLQKPRWEKTKPTIRHLYHETIVSRMGSYLPNRWPLSYLNLTKNMKTYIRRQQHKKFLNTKT